METIKQKALRFFYPLIRKLSKSGKNGAALTNSKQIVPNTSFYSLSARLNSRNAIHFNTLEGKKVLLVNTASDCGFTGQYAELQSLHEKYGDKLFIIGFPSNDFAEQEKGSDEEIAQFCSLNYGVTFPLAQKGVVIKSNAQQSVYKWLTNSELNGWNDHAPDWNFGKYLIDENGVLTHFWGSAISPLDDIILKELK